MPISAAKYCPTFSTAPTLQLPSVVSATFSAETSPTTRIHVIAPWDARLGVTLKQAASPPDAATAVTNYLGLGNDLFDGYVSSLLTPVTTSGSGNAVLHRWLDCCVEFSCTQSLLTVGGTVRMFKWAYGGVPAVTTSLPPEFYSTYAVVMQQQDQMPRPFADFVQTKCLHTAMRDRTAIEFVPGSPAQAGGNWGAIYGKTSNALDVIGAMGVPFTPIVIVVTGASLPEYLLTVRGTVEVIPPFNTAYWRLAKIPPVVKDGDEEKWWAKQRSLENSLLFPVNASVARDSLPFVGTTSAPSTTRKKRLRKPQSNGGGGQSSMGHAAKAAQRLATPVLQQLAPSAGRAMGRAILNALTGQAPGPDLLALREGGELRRRRRRRR